MPYDLKSIPAPRLSGLALRTVVKLFEAAPSRALLSPTLIRQAGLDRFRAADVSEPPAIQPLVPHCSPLGASVLGSVDLAPLSSVGDPGGVGTAAELTARYRDGSTSPLDVARRLISALRAIESWQPRSVPITAWNEENLLAQALASAERWQRGTPLSPLDGVPVSIKEEFAAVPFPTTGGTAYWNDVAREDATPVARMRAAGALIYGKANMHEIGIDPTGFNLHHGRPRNPFGADRDTGGSSSGSGAAVALGLGPLSLGADGGGSIRVPAALCGVVGLKATWSRISEHGALLICWSVAHGGPLGASVRDVALGYALMAGADPLDPMSMGQPAPRLERLTQPIAGTRIGVYRDWFDHAQADVVARAREAVDALVREGAKVVEIEVPDLELCRIAHAITILSEMRAGIGNLRITERSRMAPSVRMALALAETFRVEDYVKAQRVRTRMTRNVQKLFEQVDVIATPTTAMTAPRIEKDADAGGDVDLARTSDLMRFVVLGNMTGHPAISVPAGLDAQGLPTGLQLIGRFWEEDRLLQLAAAVERAIPPPRAQNRFRLTVDAESR